MWARSALVLAVAATIAAAPSADLSFKPAKPDEFTFNTGKLSGRLLATDKGEGIVSLVDVAGGVELTRGHANYGLFSHYRLLSPDKRWGTVIWEWPKSGRVLPDGAVQVDWPAADDHPAELSAVYRWTAPDTLDVETIVKPRQDMPKLEVFVGSYFNPNTKNLVYVSPAKYGGGGPPVFIAADPCPLFLGTYLSFPRDLKAAQLVYDGRWEQGLHPVQWSITRYLGAPLALRQDTVSGVRLVLMSRPQDCFAIECSYNQPDPPDGVGGHYSTYLSLFGRDFKAGQTERAFSRLVVRKGLSADEAVNAHQQFLDERK